MTSPAEWTPAQIEAAARALASRDIGTPLESLDHLTPMAQEHYLDVARTALTAAAQEQPESHQHVFFQERCECGVNMYDEMLGRHESQPAPHDPMCGACHGSGSVSDGRDGGDICTECGPYAQPAPEADEREVCDCASTGRIWCCMPDRHRQPGESRSQPALRPAEQHYCPVHGDLLALGDRRSLRCVEAGPGHELLQSQPAPRTVSAERVRLAGHGVYAGIYGVQAAGQFYEAADSFGERHLIPFLTALDITVEAPRG